MTRRPCRERAAPRSSAAAGATLGGTEGGRRHSQLLAEAGARRRRGALPTPQARRLRLRRAPTLSGRALGRLAAAVGKQEETERGSHFDESPNHRAGEENRAAARCTIRAAGVISCLCRAARGGGSRAGGCGWRPQERKSLFTPRARRQRRQGGAFTRAMLANSVQPTLAAQERGRRALRVACQAGSREDRGNGAGPRPERGDREGGNGGGNQNATGRKVFGSRFRGGGVCLLFLLLAPRRLPCPRAS